jgi:hypothetical protein
MFYLQGNAIQYQAQSQLFTEALGYAISYVQQHWSA